MCTSTAATAEPAGLPEAGYSSRTARSRGLSRSVRVSDFGFKHALFLSAFSCFCKNTAMMFPEASSFDLHVLWVVMLSSLIDFQYRSARRTKTTQMMATKRKITTSNNTCYNANRGRKERRSRRMRLWRSVAYLLPPLPCPRRPLFQPSAVSIWKSSQANWCAFTAPQVAESRHCFCHCWEKSVDSRARWRCVHGFCVLFFAGRVSNVFRRTLLSSLIRHVQSYSFSLTYYCALVLGSLVARCVVFLAELCPVHIVGRCSYCPP